MQDHQQRYTFIRGKSALSTREKLILFVPTLLLVAVIIWMSYWELLKPEDLKKILLSDKAWQRTFPMLLPMVLIVFFQIAIQLAYRSTKLVIDSKEMFLEWPSDSVFAKWKFLEKRIAWADLKNATYLPSFGAVHLRSKTSSLPWGIRLKDWKTSGTDELSQYAIKPAGTDLLSVLREQGIFETASEGEDPRLAAMTFDLMKHPVTRNILIGVAALVVYCFADVMMQQEGWAFFNKDYLLPHIIIAVVATLLLAWVALTSEKSKQAPKGIIAAMIVLSSFSFVVTSYVAGIRINQFAGGPLISAEYHRDDSCENLIPVEKSLPVVEYTRKTRDYWCSIDAEDVVTVKVRKGLFGLYQFDLREQTKAIRSFKQKS
ncbi:hypothetical protein ACO0LF_09930 [Undibacterium sp. Di27W]|uniref:hypothetical protein n=1 Tax=Undibacterium sp. Di27W TaxID=3413036 RepID=UPI003BF123C1